MSSLDAGALAAAGPSSAGPGATESAWRVRALFPRSVVLPLTVIAVLLLAWHLAIWRNGGPLLPVTLHFAGTEAGPWLTWERHPSNTLLPGPFDVAFGILELKQRGLLLKYIVASLFRVTWGFALAVLVGVPCGLALGWFRWAQEAFNPLIQAFRPISPIAWIPLAILWFGVSDAAPIFLIFLASVFPITVSTMAAVKSVQLVHLRAAQNFGLSGGQLFHKVILPATLPQIVTGLRIALGVAWLVVVAAEMIAVNSGLGYLIIDARNAGKRYDLVVAGMVLIGLIGWLLDLLMRQVERFQSVKWAYGIRHE